VYGKLSGELPWAGSLSSDLLCRAAEHITGARFKKAAGAEPPMATRASLYSMDPCSPRFDAACPHLAVFTALRRAIKRTKLHVTVTGDVGCMSLDLKAGNPVIETMTCMGASPSVAAGIKLAHPERRVVAVIGDSSFFHCGIQGVMNNIQHRIPVITLILDNMVTAQSGFQPDPGSAEVRNAKQGRVAMMDKMLRAMGAKVVTVNPFEKGLDGILTKAFANDESLVVIARAKCPIADKAAAY
jgi:indolepyruvate ferredoxin oxidoreductase alpha subunit